MESKDQVSVEDFFSKSNITSDWKRKIEIKLFIQSDFASGSHSMGIIRIHLMIYFLECGKQYTKETVVIRHIKGHYFTEFVLYFASWTVVFLLVKSVVRGTLFGHFISAILLVTNPFNIDCVLCVFFFVCVNPMRKGENTGRIPETSQTSYLFVFWIESSQFDNLPTSSMRCLSPEWWCTHCYQIMFISV